MVIGEILVSIGAVTQKLTRGLSRAVSAVQGFGNRIGNMLKKAALVGGVAFAAITVAGAKFEDAMTRTFAILSSGYGLAEDAMESLIERARYLGRETLFTSTQAARGMQVLALAGFNVAETIQAIGPVLETAIVGNIELAEAASITTAALRGYGLATSEAGRVSDVLASAATGANVTVSSMGESLKFVLPVARGAGIAFEEAAAAAAMLGNAGFQGSMAGTSLRRALAQMLSPTGRAKDIMEKLGVTFMDSTGNLKPLVEIIGDLNSAGITTAQTMEMFGLRAGPAMAALLRMGSGALRDMTQRLENSGGTAHRIAEMFRTTLIGRTRDLIASLNELGLTIFNAFRDPLKNAVFSIRNWVLSIERALNSSKLLDAAVQGFLRGIQPLIDRFKEIGDGIKEALEAGDAQKVGITFEAIGSVVSDFVNFLLDLPAKIADFWNNFREIMAEGGGGLQGFFAALGEKIGKPLLDGLVKIFMKMGTLLQAILTRSIEGAVGAVKQAMLELGFEMANAAKGLEGPISGKFGKALREVGEAMLKFGTATDGTNEKIKEQDDIIKETMGDLEQLSKDFASTTDEREKDTKAAEEQAAAGEAPMDEERSKEYWKWRRGLGERPEWLEKQKMPEKSYEDLMSEAVLEAARMGGPEAARETAEAWRQAAPLIREERKQRGLDLEGVEEDSQMMNEAAAAGIETTKNTFKKIHENIVNTAKLVEDLQDIQINVDFTGKNNIDVYSA